MTDIPTDEELDKWYVETALDSSKLAARLRAALDEVKSLREKERENHMTIVCYESDLALLRKERGDILAWIIQSDVSIGDIIERLNSD
jgi:hypothetical protein